jgi:hypothetical protein
VEGSILRVNNLINNNFLEKYMSNLKLKTLEFIKKSIEEKSLIIEILFDESKNIIEILPEKKEKELLEYLKLDKKDLKDEVSEILHDLKEEELIEVTEKNRRRYPSGNCYLWTWTGNTDCIIITRKGLKYIKSGGQEENSNSANFSVGAIHNYGAMAVGSPNSNVSLNQYIQNNPKIEEKFEELKEAIKKNDKNTFQKNIDFLLTTGLTLLQIIQIIRGFSLF